MGMIFLAGYVLFIGVATFLMKFVMKNLTVYQINLLMAIGMLVVTLPAMYLSQKNFKFPTEGLALGAFTGLLMAIGSLLFVFAISKLPIGIASAISTSYVVVVVLLSWIFLKEPIGPLKLIGIALTVAGVAILSL